ncbi:MAG: transporter substrate-binding domain-containing protein [Beijerinckiaceae bacterium]
MTCSLRTWLAASISAPLRLFVIFLAVITMQTPLHAQMLNDEPARKLIVGALRLPPFVMRGDDGKWTGLTIELWEQIAAETKRPFELREFDYDEEGLIKAVKAGEIDLSIGAIPVTAEGEATFDFSHPYFASGLGIAVKTEPQGSILASLSSLLTSQLLGTVGILLMALVSVGALVWLLERKRNAQSFHSHPVKGIGDGVWWAAVTMTTTGYGDKTPITAPGRAVALLWMFASIFGIAMFSATLASSFVVGKLKSGITGPADLPGARIGVVGGSGGEQWLSAQGIASRSYPFVIQAVRALQRGDLDAVVFERAVLGHMIKAYDWKDLQILPQTMAIRDYAIALPTGSALREEINRALLIVVQRREWRDTVQKHVGAKDF